MEAEMGARFIDGSDQRFSAYAEDLAGSFGHADRHEPMRDCCLGRLLPIDRKSVEPMAAVMAPAEVAAKHQSMLHFVGNAPWSDATVLAKVQALALPKIDGIHIQPPHRPMAVVEKDVAHGADSAVVCHDAVAFDRRCVPQHCCFSWVCLCLSSKVGHR
jgi:hypothetical protein